MSLLTSVAYRLRGKGLGKIPGAKWVYGQLRPKEQVLRKVKVLDFEMWVDLRDLGDLTPALTLKGVQYPIMTQVVRETIKPGMVCVDVGANIGYFTLIMARLGASVLALEPEPKNFWLLETNLLLNRVQSQVQPLKYAVSNKSGSATFITNKNYIGDFHLGTSSKEGGISVSTISLNSLLKSTKVDFIKVDTEGTEIETLAGMLQVLENNRDIVTTWVFLPERLREGGYSPLILLRSLESLGYSLWDMDERRKSLIPMYSNQIAEKYKKGGTHLLVKRGKRG